MPVTVKQRMDTPAIKELAQPEQWVRWKLEQPPGKKPTKVPYCLDGQTHASTTDPYTWAQFDITLASAKPLTERGGIGYVFVEHGGLVGVDLDGCRDPDTGRIAPWAQQWIDGLASYCEVSPSGTGVKLWIHGQWPGDSGRKVTLPKAEKITPLKEPAIEAYSKGRYFAVTGQHLAGTPSWILDNQAALDALYAGYFATTATAGAAAPAEPILPSPGLTDEDVLGIARQAGPDGGAKFRGLYDDGDVTAHGGQDKTHNAADLGLVSMLLFYTGDDLDQLDRLFRASALYRASKWGRRKDYRERTIKRAARGMTEVYSQSWGGSQNGVVMPVSSPPAEPEPPAWTSSRLISDAEIGLAARDTWLDRYVAYCQLRTDAPACFHETLGVVALSAAVGRRGAMKLSQGPQFPSLYVLVIAPSTIYRKSTALDLLREIIALVDSDLMAPNDFTPQRFVAIMAEHNARPLVFARDEFSGFYEGLNKLDFMSGLKELLCDIYDGRAFRREKMKTKKRKADADDHTGPVVRRATDPPPESSDDSEWKHDIKEPFLSIAAGTTMDRFIEVARIGDIGSGFLPRFALVVPDGPPPTGDLEISEMTEAMEQARDALVNDLKVLAHMDLQLTVDPLAFKRFNAYARAINKEAMNAPSTDLVAIIGGRSAWMAFRTSVLLAAMDTITTAGVGGLKLPHLLRGIELAERWRATAIKVLAGLAPSRMERQTTRLMDAIRARTDRRLSRRDAMRLLRVSKKEMNDIEATLEDRGEITIDRVTTTGPQRLIYVAV